MKLMKKIRRKAAVANIVTCLVTVFVLGIALYALWQTNQIFTKAWVQTETMMGSIKDIYGYGLQQGQAIRNIILDPGNSIAYNNLDKASESFNKSCLGFIEAAETAGEKRFSSKVREIYEREKEDLKIINEIKELAKSGLKDQAIETLNKKETPLWRKNREMILTLNKEIEEYRKRNHVQIREKTYSYMAILALITILPILVSLTLGFILTSAWRSISRIGGGLKEGSDLVASSAGQITSTSQSLAERALTQAAGLKETSSSIGTMTSMTKQNAENANMANTLMQENTKVVDEANQAMEELTKSMEEITAAVAAFSAWHDVFDKNRSTFSAIAFPEFISRGLIKRPEEERAPDVR